MKSKSKAMEINIIENLSNETYHNSEEYKDYWSSSNLKEYLVTPREAYYQKFIAESKNTDALMFGNQLHDFFASKHINGQTFDWNIFEPPVNPSTKMPYSKASDKYQNVLAQIENPISPEDYEIIHDIWKMILNSSYAWFIQKEVLKKGLSEPSIFIDGLHKYKYRPDVVTDKYIFDYKSISKQYWDASRLNYRIIDFGYDISAAMYQYFEHQRTGIWKPFLLIWIMKDPPFDILITDISQYCFEEIGDGEVIVNSGANVFLKIKDQHELCDLNKKWPGLANQFDAYNGLRIPKFAPRFDRGYDEFEVETDEF